MYTYAHICIHTHTHIYTHRDLSWATVSPVPTASQSWRWTQIRTLISIYHTHPPTHRCGYTVTHKHVNTHIYIPQAGAPASL